MLAIVQKNFSEIKFLILSLIPLLVAAGVNGFERHNNEFSEIKTNFIFEVAFCFLNNNNNNNQRNYYRKGFLIFDSRCCPLSRAIFLLIIAPL